ncbi:MAG TPA: methyl-accepting chemotaxis protein [Terriglobales bacterium]|nr:methyl-accepting chemotaxis protein [Terriglobales bacterium]
MFKNLKLTGKIIGSIVVTLVATSAISFWVTQRRINQQAEESFRDKVRQITGMAGATRTWFSGNLATLVPDHNFKHLTQVPVVAAWSVAREYAEGQGMKFHTPSLSPRDPKNQPDAFERQALEAFQSNSSLKEYSERVVEDGKDVMRYAQPVRVSEDCLLCHGNPAGEKDPFGFTKEGMKAGDLRGAFSVTASTQQLVQTAASNSIALFLLSLLTLLTAVGVVFSLIRKLVVKPLSVSVNLANRIADNDLSVEDIAVDSQDEIGEATLALNKMKNNLRQMIQSIAGTAEHVASASEEISSSATQQANSAETQKDQATQVATAMQEMSSTVLQVSENSNKAAESSRHAADTARQGGAIVEETLHKMRVIVGSVGATAKKMEELGKSSDQIGRIIGVIDDIADQTNLLALNAAIEAARAGEQGRGFAVVADEVRKLAERTTTATKEIAQMIKNIQDETKTAVTAMEEGTKQVEEGVSSTAKAGDSLKEIIHMAEQVGEMIMHIATASTEQSSASEEINNNMEQIARLVKESAAGAQQSAKACQELSGLALDLQKMVEAFRLDTPGGRGRGMASRLNENSSQSKTESPKAYAATAR